HHLYYLLTLIGLNFFFSFFFTVPTTTEIYTLSLHDALPIYLEERRAVEDHTCGIACSSIPHGGGNCDDQRLSCALLIVECRNTGDRKSTRLNSSHVAISYAVFCLKKKTASTGAKSISPSPNL